METTPISKSTPLASGVSRKMTSGRPSALACTECRRKHLKCDGRLPTCARCIANELRCSYQKSRRGGKRKRPHNNRPQDSLSSPAQQDYVSNSQWIEAQSTTALLPINSATVLDDSDGRDFQTPIPPDSVQSLESIRSENIQNADPGARGLPEETLVELYYENFHRAHPVLLPKCLYDNRKYPRYVNAVVQYIGSHYSGTSICPLREAISSEFAQIENLQSPSVVQAKLLYAIALYSNGEVDESHKQLNEAVELAISLGMNKGDFARFYAQQDNQIEAESFRRTWWELYVVDGYLAAIEHRLSFRTNSVECDVEMPCEESVYAEAKDIPLPVSRQALEDCIFSENESVFSSFAYRIDAIGLLARVLAVRDPNVARRDKAQAVDNTLASWAHYLPTSKAAIVNPYGEIDEMLLQAHMMIQYAGILLHFPRSSLTLISPTSNNLPQPISGKLPPSTTRHIHAIKATEASKRLSNLFSLCSSMQKHTPLFMFSLSLCGFVQLSTFRAHCQVEGGSNCLEQHRDRVRLIIGLLKSSSDSWQFSKVLAQQMRKAAADTFRSPVSSWILPLEDQIDDGSPNTNASMIPTLENQWPQIVGDFDLPELAPWMWSQ